MRITWYGHAAFRIEAAGLRIVLDPYRSPDSGGYAPVDDTADLVVVSHLNDRYHSHLGQIRPPFHVVPALGIPRGGATFLGLKIDAVRVFETPDRSVGDEVTIVHFRSEGLHLAFLGDLGHLLSDEELVPIRGADVVLVPAGGPPTIAVEDLPPLLRAIGPRLILPMHYKTSGIDLKIRPVDDFLAAFPRLPVDRPGTSTLDVTRETLPNSPRIVVLDYAR